MLGDKILLILSRKPHEPDCFESNQKYSIDNGLDKLVSTFGVSFLEEIRNKTILDYGCGAGYQVVAMALKGAKSVVGLEVRNDLFKEGINLSREYHVESKVKFSTCLDYRQKYDIIISQNSFEHYDDPCAILEEWKKLLKKGGKIYVTFGPPWYAPYGSHMHFFTRLPWVNILFAERTVMKVRSRFRADGATRYQDVDRGLNKTTVKKFERLIKNSEFKTDYLNYTAVKNINILAKIPYLRELFINNIDCILRDIKTL